MTRLEIEAFLTIIKNGSISAAAEQLFITQPALSRRIHALEQELGYDLFIRGKGIRTVTITEEGSAFIPVAEKWMHVYREALAISRLKQKPILNLSSIGSVSTYLLPNVLRQIVSDTNEYNLCFHMYHSFEAYSYVESGLVDIALISDDMYHRTVLTTPLFREPFVLIGGPEWTDRRSIHPSELDPRNEIWLPWNPEFAAWHDKWFDVTIYPSVQLDQMSLIEEFLTDRNFAIVPLAVALRLKKKSVQICRLENGPEDEIIYSLTLPANQKKAPLIRHFLQLFKEEICTLDGVQIYI
ncbi:MAG: LysR family transcriptional regulator [Lachnospiraceae bacterium]|nr:LysR family transcriptional regulator [Lachnospiraceae bacterium]